MKSKFTLKIPPFFMARAYLQVIKKADFLKYPKQFLQIALLLVLLFAFSSTYAQNASPVCASPQTFNYTGGVQDFVVPTGVTLITVAATGADGGGSFSGFPNVGGSGGGINASFSVLPGDNIRVIVGEAGKSTFGGGGGGGTAVINCGNPANCATGTLMIVAGGGGGGKPGSSAGGGATAVAGNGAAGADGVGGGGGGGVNGGSSSGHNGSQASKTNISAGGSGGGTASDGGKGFGGGGGIQSPPGGGGGGGGYTGGDGSVFSGNGGSNFVASTAIVGFTNTGGVNAGSGSDNTNGVVVLSYTCPDPCAVFTNNRVYINQAIASSGDGSSWATAFKTLQEALTLNCPSVTQIWVAKGTYYPTTSTTDRNASFSMKNGVAIYGGFAGNEAANYDLSLRNFVTNVTILSGDIDGVPDMVTGSGSSLTITGNAGNAYHVVLNNNNGLTSSAVLDGFTISGGNANFPTPSNDIYGGGMFNNLVSPTLRNVTFLGNSAIFTGGGLYTSNGNLTLTKCQFTNNLADFGGAIQTQGTVSSLTATITMVDCSLTGNRSFTAGGINHGFSNSRGQLLFDCNRCVFSNNYAYNGSNYGSAGAFFNEQVGFDGRFTNCLFDGNQGLGNDPDEGGGALLVYQGTVTVVNSTFINNRAAAKGGAIRIYLGSGTVNIKNSIFWNNTATTADNDISTNTGGIFSIQNSLLQVASCPANITCGTGMLYNQNPLFVNLAGGDLRLQACSPAINAGTSSGAPATDILGNARVGATDMGAYEFQGNPIVINAPTVTQPTCTTPTGSIVVNATGTGTLEYSIDNGSTWQTNATFSGLAVGNYTIKVRTQGSPSCEVIYASNPVVLTSPFTASTTTDTWTGCVSTNWATPGNWADGSVPTAADDAVIPNTTNKPTIVGGTAALAKTIEVQSGATLTIATTASLTVNGSKSISGNTIALFNGGTVTNSGLVAIGGSTLADIGKYGIRNEGTFTNSTGGNIQIDRWTDTGLYNQAGSFSNSGNIMLGASAATGKDGLFNNAIFNNTGAGLIQIDRSFTAGISNLFSATFTNSATIIIGSLASVGTHGILNQATFNNNACGKILMSLGNYTNFSGTTTNAGLIQMPNTSNFTNQGTFTNNGVVKANTVASITNNKMVITNACPIFTLGGTNNYTVNGIFTDAAATTSAGTYASVGNKFTANNTLPMGTQTLYAQVTDGTCTFVVLFDFNNVKPTGVSVNTTTVCTGGSVMLSATCASGTPTWYTTAAGGSSIGTGTSLSNSPTVATTYYSACETTNCVSGRVATSAVSIATLPTATANSNSPICAGNTLNLTGGGVGNSYAWTSSNGFTSTDQSPSIPNATVSASGTYTITVTNTNGCTSTASVAVTVNALPTATANSNSPICAGNTLNLTGGGVGTSYAWTSSNGFTSTDQSPSIPNATVSASGTYTITVTNVNGCINTATTAVVINALPTATATNNSPICSGITLNLTGGGVGSYLWNGPNSYTSTAQSPSIPSATASMSGTYTITVTNVSGCTSTATTSVTVNPVTAMPTPQANTQIIFGANITLTATGCSGVNDVLKWYKSADNSLATMPVSPTATTNFYAKCERTLNTITCTSGNSVDVTVTVLQPNPPVAMGATNCLGTPTTLTATGCSGSVGTFVLKWYQNSNNALVTMPVSPTTTTDFYAKCEQTFNAVTAISAKSNIVTLTILNPPTPVSTGGTIYLGNSISLTATGCTGTLGTFTLKWYQTSDNALVTMPVSPTVTTQYYSRCEQMANSVTCASAKSADVTVTVVNRIFVDITKVAAPIQNGNSWATAYGNLQTGLAAATPNVEVWVAKGTYKPTNTITRTIYFNIPSSVLVYGGFAGTEDNLMDRNFRTNVTILSGDIGIQNVNTDNSYHVVVMNASSNTTVLDGFTIMGGNANFDPKQTFNAPLTAPTTATIETGGGILVQNAGMPTIANCTIIQNTAVTGGGLYAGDASMPTIMFCKFTANQAGFGSGMYFQDGSNGKVNNTLISGNRGIGGVYNNKSNPMFTNVTLAGNGGYNGGIFNSNSQPVVKNSIIWGNSTPFNDTQSIITYSTIQGGYAGVGNLSMNPKFVNLTPEGLSPILSGDYHIQASSLTIDRGDNGAISLTNNDLDGNLRRFAGGRVDMGAFEFQGTATATLIISVQTGNWEINSTWDLGRVPQLGDYVIIDSNHIVTLNGTGIAKNLEYRGTGQLKFNSTTGKIEIGF